MKNELPPLLLLLGLLCDETLWHRQVYGLRDSVETIIGDTTLGESITEIADAALIN